MDFSVDASSSWWLSNNVGLGITIIAFPLLSTSKIVPEPSNLRCQTWTEAALFVWDQFTCMADNKVCFLIFFFQGWLELPVLDLYPGLRQLELLSVFKSIGQVER